MTNESRWEPSGIIWAEYSSSVSGNWTDKSLCPQGVCAGCPGTNSVRQVPPLGQKLTGDMWWEVMHPARHVVPPPSVCIVDRLSSTSGQAHCPVSSVSRKAWIHINTILLFRSFSAHIPPSHFVHTVLPVLAFLSLMHVWYTYDWFWANRCSICSSNHCSPSPCLCHC